MFLADLLKAYPLIMMLDIEVYFYTLERSFLAMLLAFD